MLEGNLKVFFSIFTTSFYLLLSLKHEPFNCCDKLSFVDFSIFLFVGVLLEHSGSSLGNIPTRMANIVITIPRMTHPSHL